MSWDAFGGLEGHESVRCTRNRLRDEDVGLRSHESEGDTKATRAYWLMRSLRHCDSGGTKDNRVAAKDCHVLPEMEGVGILIIGVLVP